MLVTRTVVTGFTGAGRRLALCRMYRHTGPRVVNRLEPATPRRVDNR